MNRVLRLWFSFVPPVGRREYVLSGLLLGAIKYLGDAALIYATTGRVWTVLDYVSPAANLAGTRSAGGPDYLLPVLAVWSLPFLWIGVSMSMRRAIDAKWSAWSALFFFVPFLNYLTLLVLSLLPTDHGRATWPEPPLSTIDSRLPRVLDATLWGVSIALAMVGLSVYALSNYGAALFFGTPFVMGAVTAYRFNRREPSSQKDTMKVVVMSYLVVAGVLVLTAAEGFACLTMAAPLALGIGTMGAYLGRQLASRDPRSPQAAWLGILMLPISATVEARLAPTDLRLPLREVRSAVEIDAPPEVVWQQVIAFPPMPEPGALVRRSGIAYPVRAEIRGAGVGAVRYCVFSTGAFVEPITAWEPGRRLAFTVDSQPRALTEWSPYANVTPPHLDGYFTSRRGEFRLIALAGNRTRLEGSTWYQMELAPAAYWVLFGDGIIHAIHDRVLSHIKRNAEQAPALASSASSIPQ